MRKLFKEKRRDAEEMSGENTRGFVARLQAKSVANANTLSFMERKYMEAADRVAKRKK